MDYINFTKELKQIVKKKIGDQYQVSIGQVLKNNGLTKDSILIKEAEASTSPNIYLDYFYERYCECESLDEISDEIIKSYYEAISQKPEDMINDFNFENYKQKIFFRIVHFESNKTLLNTIPHIPFLDLAITFHCMVSDYSMEIQFFTVSNLLMETWGITVNELYQIALDNTQQLFPAHIASLEHITQQLLWRNNSYQTILNNTDFESELSNLPDKVELQMLVLTNQFGLNGAAVILYPNLLTRLAEKLQANLYLLPSSIHEFIVLPEDCNLYLELSKMVFEVNTHEVSRDEILSNHVYFYDWEKNVLTEQVDKISFPPTF